MSFKIAIDGPNGSGKSELAKNLAKELGFIYIDTGAMYRCVGLYCLNNHINPEDEIEVSAVLDKIKIVIEHEDDIQVIYLNEKNVTKEIRTMEIAQAASMVAVHKNVRMKLVELQRKIGQNKNIIMDGRDIGTYVFPDANLKIYLDADIDVRTKRRCGELIKNHQPADFEQIKKEIIERDDRDTNREFAPQAKADDAIIIDTSPYDALEVKKIVASLVNERLDINRGL